MSNEIGKFPTLNISITKAPINGQTFDIVEYQEYRDNLEGYKDRSDIAVPVDYNGREMMLPYKGQYKGPTMVPGIYNAGCIDFVVKPEEGFADKYIPDPTSVIRLSNTDDIRDLIMKEDSVKKLDEPFITTPDNITNIPINQNDQPEMICLKKALNAKKIDIDKYANRFGDNYPNDKRQLKSKSATLNIIKRYCANCDMEAILILKDAGPNVPNPMGTEIAVSLTSVTSDDIETVKPLPADMDSDDDWEDNF